jgi:hypothetical protein
MLRLCGIAIPAKITNPDGSQQSESGCKEQKEK